MMKFFIQIHDYSGFTLVYFKWSQSRIVTETVDCSMDLVAFFSYFKHQMAEIGLTAFDQEFLMTRKLMKLKSII